MARKMIFRLLALGLLLGGAVCIGCTTDPLIMGPNGDSRLREITFLNRTLDPPFNPTKTKYSIYEGGDQQVIGFMKTFMFHSRFTLNGQSVRMQTNIYALPDMTDLTKYFTNAQGGMDLGTDRRCIIEVTAQDGNKREYRIDMRGNNADARIKDIRATHSTSTMILRHAFRDGGGPYYSVSGKEETNVIEISVGETTADITIEKSFAGAKLYFDGNTVESGVGQAAVDLQLSGITSGGTEFDLEIVSSDGSTTNHKTLLAYQYPVTSDARIIDMEVHSGGKKLTFLPHFDYNGALSWSTNRRANNVGALAAGDPTIITEAMVVILDDADRVSISGKLMYSDTTLETRMSNQLAPRGSYSPTMQYLVLVPRPDITIQQAPGSVDFTIPEFTVNQGDRLTIAASKGGKTIIYVFEFRLYTHESYGFDGGIRELQRLCYLFTDTTGKGISSTITGVISMLNIYPDGIGREGWFMEDGQYGLYCWTYNGYPEASRPGHIQVGQRIRMQVDVVKLWQNMPEVTETPPTKTEPLDDKVRRPVSYISANMLAFEGIRHLGRLMRFSTEEGGAPLASDFDANGIGALDSVKNYMFYLPYTKTLASLYPQTGFNWYKYSADAAQTVADGKKTVVITHVTEYMKAGQQGVFYGPMFMDAEGSTMIVKDKYYIVVP
ncbi:MAG: hypothetical protein LBC99_01400 [Spirochaetota bacterium]|nr:hypothetical protein [Spirochaetota bacterium]